MPDLMLKQAASILDIGSLTLTRKLKEKGLIGKTNNLPRLDLVRRGYFKVDIRKYRKPSGIEVPYSVTLVTPNGLSFIRDFLEQEEENGEPESCSPKQQH